MKPDRICSIICNTVSHTIASIKPKKDNMFNILKHKKLFNIFYTKKSKKDILDFFKKTQIM